MAGGSQGFGQGVVSRVADAVRGTNPQSAPSNVGAVFNQATPNVYTPTFAPIQQAPMAPAQQVQQAGLQALMANMMAQYQNVPGALAMTQQRPQMPAPRFSAPALSYRPNIQAVQQNLSRVKPSVYKTDLDNARARIAELEAAEQARNAASDTGYYSGG